MRFKLHLKPKRDKQRLIFNYQYPLQAWLYQLIFKADNDYAHFLHNKGYSVPDSFKTFKHFTFSSLQIKNAKPVRKGDTFIQLGSENLTLIVSFFIDKAAEDFIIGLFQNQEVSLYNRDLRADFIVERVESLENGIERKPIENEKVTMKFRTISPMVVALKEDSIDKYLSPIDSLFAGFFGLNLIDRNRTLQGSEGMKMDVETAKRIVNFKLLSDPTKIKKRGFTVKEGKLHAQTKVIGYYNFTFEITAPLQLIEVGYMGGFGKECAMGCGCVEIAEMENSK